ncbi:MAG: hypothetical protein IPM06_16765, partial [Rhizobiales bacterium]|nr:hypothetical protein [Hyphomicrobiales bacterium]
LDIVIRVADNGPGISADNLAKIREPLYTTKSFGTGLGLPAVEKKSWNSTVATSKFPRSPARDRSSTFICLLKAGCKA